MSKKILMIDDDPDTVEIATYVLSMYGYEVFSASSPDEALEKLTKEKPHLILLDVSLSESDGLKLLKELKVKERIPVIIYTAHSHLMEERVKEIGCEGFIAKPVSPYKIAEEIKKVLGE